MIRVLGVDILIWVEQRDVFLCLLPPTPTTRMSLEEGFRMRLVLPLNLNGFLPFKNNTQRCVSSQKHVGRDVRAAGRAV